MRVMRDVPVAVAARPLEVGPEARGRAGHADGELFGRPREVAQLAPRLDVPDVDNLPHHKVLVDIR